MSDEPGQGYSPNQVHDEDCRYILIDTAVLDKFDAKDMTPTTFTVYAALKAFANSQGQCFPSHATLADRAHCSVSAVKGAINTLLKLKLVSKEVRTRQDTGQTSNLYIIRRSQNAPQPPENHPQSPRSYPPSHDEATPQVSGGYKEQSLKNTKVNDKGETPLTPRQVAVQSWFDEFWELYPNKVAKPAAVKAYARIVKSQEDADHVLEGLHRWRLCHKWLKDNGDFVPHPSKFLNQRYFDNEPPAGPGREAVASGRSHTWRDES